MFFEHVSVIGLAHVEPPLCVTTADIDERLAPTLDRLGVRPGFIQALTGIKERRFWEPGVQPSVVARLAAERAIADAGVDRARIGILVNSSVIRDFVEPSTACIIHAALGLSPTCMNFDVSNACLGFLDGMEIVSQMIELGAVDYGIVVDGECPMHGIEKTLERMLHPSCDEEAFRKQLATLTLGAGAVAMVLGRKELCPQGHAYRGSVGLAATQHNELCRAQVDWMETEVTALLQAGVTLAVETWEKAKQIFGWTNDELALVATHQVSKMYTKLFMRAIGLDPAKLPKTFPFYGNVASASVPFVISKARDQGWLRTGDRVALLGVGSGVNCRVAEIVW